MPSVAKKKPSRGPSSTRSLLKEDGLSVIEAREKAQFIAFGPVVFKVALALRNFGILRSLEDAGEAGLTFESLGERVSISEYGLRVLVDGGVQSGLISARGAELSLSTTGYFVLNDAMTAVNFNFVNDVCYRGLDHLEEAVRTGKPEGLREFGQWPTIYCALSELPEPVRKSWLDFDHFYSDGAFARALLRVFRGRPKRLLDIGGNTGKFSIECTRHDRDVEVTIADLPGQLALAQRNVAADPNASRIHFHAANMLEDEMRLPEGFDAIWMSQFLDCFAGAEIVRILRACLRVMGDETLLYILEPLTDRQRFQGAAFALQMTSLYFTTMANGNSRMYSFEDMSRFALEAGLEVREVSEPSFCQSLMVLQRPGASPIRKPAPVAVV